MDEKTIIALEIGSSKIKGAIGTISADGALNVTAVEEEPILDIVRYGMIRNIFETAQAVRNVISRLELRVAPRKVQSVYLSVGGRSLISQPTERERRLPMETIITKELLDDITAEVLESPMHDRTIVGATPRELLIDKAVTTKPIGVMGSLIQARLNLISCRTQMIRNLAVVVEEKLGLKIADTFVRPLALADLVLLNDEKKLGCVLVDFGAETTTVAIYRGGSLQHLAVLPMGSRNITRDIASLNYLEEQAEEIKKNSGSAVPTPGELQPISSQSPDISTINNYVAARAGEIILNICEQIKYAGLTPDRLPHGIIIVGQGSRLARFNQRLEQMSGLKVRTGVPGNRLRILDGRIQVADSVDVLAILAAAAHNDPIDCLTPTQPEPKPEPQPMAQPQAQPQAPYGNPYGAPAQPQQGYG
ncbi:MAG: cell division protein FtsA, partial [Duncaniella sp.]|nr:cell division protein FtsA [Duncaniella sp.]